MIYLQTLIDATFGRTKILCFFFKLNYYYFYLYNINKKTTYFKVRNICLFKSRVIYLFKHTYSSMSSSLASKAEI